jgi:hypothetical protein
VCRKVDFIITLGSPEETIKAAHKVELKFCDVTDLSLPKSRKFRC